MTKTFNSLDAQSQLRIDVHSVVTVHLGFQLEIQPDFIPTLKTMSLQALEGDGRRLPKPCYS